MARPSVDIIIPYYGQYDRVMACIESIQKCTPNQPYTLCLVDDHSPNTTFRTSFRGKVTSIRTSKQIGFAGALLEGYHATSSDWIVFLQSDVIIDNIYWLLTMQRTMEKMKKNGIKLVSSRVTSVGTANDYDPELIWDEKKDDFIATKPIPLICTLCHRHLFPQIGGFLKQYPFGWFEDEELYRRMAKYKYKQAISGASHVQHVGGSTIYELWAKKPEARKIMEDNYNLCLTDLRTLKA